jgi:hypothetical protein
MTSRVLVYEFWFLISDFWFLSDRHCLVDPGFIGVGDPSHFVRPLSSVDFKDAKFLFFYIFCLFSLQS